MSVLRGLGTALPVTLMIIFYSVLPSVPNRQFIIQTHHIILQLIVLDLLQILNHHPAYPLHTHDHLLHPGPGRNPQGHQLHLHPILALSTCSPVFILKCTALQNFTLSINKLFFIISRSWLKSAMFALNSKSRLTTF